MPAIADAYESNLILSCEELLVVSLYNSSEEMRLFRIHTEMIQADTIHGTNKEKRNFSR